MKKRIAFISFDNETDGEGVDYYGYIVKFPNETLFVSTPMSCDEEVYEKFTTILRSSKTPIPCVYVKYSDVFFVLRSHWFTLNIKRFNLETICKPIWILSYIDFK